MRWTLAGVGCAAVFGLALCTACTFGQVGMDFNGSVESPALFHPNDLLDFHINGPAGSPFAALISPHGIFEVTPYGILVADPLHPEAVVFFDGFDPYSPTYGTATIPLGGGPFAQSFIPFLYGNTYAPAYWVQAIVADPSHPLGLRLTNEIVLVYDSPPPTLIDIQPNFAPPGTAVTLVGTDFETNPALNVVRLNGQELQVITACPTALFVMIPLNAQSGTISVETTHGITPYTPEAMATWFAVTPAQFCEEALAPSVIQGPTTILGMLPFAQSKDFVFHLEAGQELIAEAYVFDLAHFTITGQTNTMTPYFDPFLRVRRNPQLPITVLTDDDSGPQVTAAIGLPNAGPHYVAPIAEDVVVQIDSQAGASFGPYLLVLSARSAAGLPVSVQCVMPSDARPGDMVTVFGTGFDPANPALHTVILNGGSAVADTVTPGTLGFQVPAGARSGPVVVSSPAGQSIYNSDRIESWLCVHAFPETWAVEGGPPQNIPAAGVVRGTIWPSNDIDDYTVNLVAGQTLSLECHATDPASGTIVSGAILSPFPLDAELRIMAFGPGGNLLAYDQNSGPGLSAGLGIGTGSPPFTAPYTGTFQIRVSSFFTWSSGDYVLAIGPGP